MEHLPVAIQLLLSFILGGLIGFEREINEKKIVGKEKTPRAILGLRTFALVGSLGAIAGILYDQYLFLSLLLTTLMGIFLIVFYTIDSLQTKDAGVTTEIALLYTFLLGILIALHALPIQVILAISVVLVLLLSRKETIKNFASDIKQYELHSFVSYAVIALVVLPFLPNTTFSLAAIPVLKTVIENLDISSKVVHTAFFNPFKLWLIVTLITGVDILGYVLERTIGQRKGWLLASAAGGFISSTATTQSLAQQSKASSDTRHLVAAAVVANLTSFFQVGILLATLNSMFFLKTLPSLIAIIGTAIGIVFFLLRSEKGKKRNIQTIGIRPHSIFSLGPALKFALLFLLITVVSKVSLALFGNGGFLVTSAIGALAGIDAVMINTAELAGRTIEYRLAVLTFILVNGVNLSAKSVYSFLQGKRAFAVQFSLSMALLIASSVVGLFFV